MNFDLRTCIEEVVDLVAGQAHLKDLEISILIDRHLPTKLHGDLVKLNQILSILIFNAVKLTKTGEIIIKAELKRESDRTVTILFTIQDTSSGFSSEEQYAISELFNQVEPSHPREASALSIELVVCHKLIRMLAGEIGLEPNEGKGATFWFNLTFNKQIATSAILPAIDLSGLRLLVVSENPTTREIIRQHAATWQMGTVDEAINATTAMNSLRNMVAEGKPYHIALIDMQMSVLSGEVLGQAITADETLSSTKLIIMTYIHEQEWSERLMSRGFTGLLVKPIKQLPLLHTLLDASADLVIVQPDQENQDSNHPESGVAVPLDSTDIVDLNHLVKICEGDRQSMISMIDQFLEDGPKRVAMMSAAVAEDDFFSLGQHAHFLRGSSVTLGSNFAANIADRLKQQASNHNTAGCLNMVVALEKGIEQLREQRERILVEIDRLVSDAPDPSTINMASNDTPIRILLVDDDRMTLTWLSDRLQQVPNYKVTTASSGEMAWNCVCTDTFNIIVSDWSMPDMSGIVLCQRLKFCPQLPSALAPFILLTAFKDVDYQKIARDAGVDDFIVKPVNPEDLRNKIAFWTGSDSINT